MELDNVNQYLGHKNDFEEEFKKGTFKKFHNIDYLNKKLPEIYTPGIGEICLDFHNNPFEIDGLYIDTFLKKKAIKEQIENFKSEEDKIKIKIIVITDGSRILGFGDLGYNGYPICDAKIFIHRIFSDYSKDECLPVFIDLGTNNEDLLRDKNYKGCLKERESIDKEVKKIIYIVDRLNNFFPNAVIHFEDFSYPKSKLVLQECIKEYYNIFNDDIEGTAVIVLVALLNLTNKIKIDLLNTKILFLGSGSVTYGILNLMEEYFNIDKDNIILVDSQGLVGRREFYSDDLKRSYAKISSEQKDISKIIKQFKPQIIIGASGIPNLVSDKDLKYLLNLKKYNELIVFSLGNPEEKTEIKYTNYIKENKNIHYATGASIPDTIQLNNYLVFPILAKRLLENKNLIKKREEIFKDLINELRDLTPDNCFIPKINNLFI
jgi:malic enzyme